MKAGKRGLFPDCIACIGSNRDAGSAVDCERKMSDFESEIQALKQFARWEKRTIDGAFRRSFGSQDNERRTFAPKFPRRHSRPECLDILQPSYSFNDNRLRQTSGKLPLSEALESAPGRTGVARIEGVSKESPRSRSPWQRDHAYCQSTQMMSA